MAMIIIDGYISDTFNQATPERRAPSAVADGFWVTSSTVASHLNTIQKDIADQHRREEEAKKPKTERTYRSGGLTIFY